MRHEEHGESRVRPELQQLVLHLATRESVERSEGFIHQQHVGLHRHAARDRDTLFHPAGKGVRIAVDEFRQVDLVEITERARLGLRAAHPAARGEREGDVLLHRFPRQELIKFLEHHHAIRSGLGDDAILQPHLPLGGMQVTPDRLKQRGFPAARGPEQDKAVRFEDVKADAKSRRHERLLRLVLQRHALDIEQRRGVLGGGGSRGD